MEPARVVLRYLRTLTPPAGAGEPSDGQLLECFAAGRDEAAFTALARRHGPLVWGVCRRRLRHHQDAEDAFQAIFLVLARKAGAIRRPELLANWLYGVACRTADRARADAARWRACEQGAAVAGVVMPSSDVLWRDLRPVLDEEVQRLPAKYRTPFVLCYLEGHTNEEAARRIGCPKGTVLSRLAWARERLRARLRRRGVALAVAGLAGVLNQDRAPGAVPAPLVEGTVQGALTRAGRNEVAGGSASTRAAALAQGVITSMILTKVKTSLALVLLVGAVGIGALTYAGQGGKKPGPSTPAAPAEGKGEKLDPTALFLRDRMGRKLEAAKAAYDARWNEFMAGRGMFEFLYLSARRLLDSELDLSKTKADRVKAYKEHFVRMSQIELVMKERFDYGKVPFYDFETAKFWNLEAEIWWTRERAK